jgi:hypothetical protein
MNSYWELYVNYVHRCVKKNETYGVDPHHYELEWNHFLPVSVFGDWPFGHYLTLRQHAIATALQSLALGRNCICAWHLKHLPKELLTLVKDLYRQGAKNANTKLLQKRLDPDFNEAWKESQARGARNKYNSDEEYREGHIARIKQNQPKACAAALTKTSKLKRIESFRKIRHQQGEANSQYGTMWVTNGSDNRRIKKTEPIPEGYYPGRKLK